VIAESFLQWHCFAAHYHHFGIDGLQVDYIDSKASVFNNTTLPITLSSKWFKFDGISNELSVVGIIK
jgi:hypothetical protein